MIKEIITIAVINVIFNRVYNNYSIMRIKICKDQIEYLL